MSRYRPPTKPSSGYISHAGEVKLKEELRYLWKEERPRVTRSVSEAAAQGDRSENAEYTYGKKRLREIDRRVRYLTKRLEEVTVVRQKPDDTSRIYFGATVTLADEDDKQIFCKLLGADEIEPGSITISIDSPMGKALLGKRTGDEIDLNSPGGSKFYRILEITYET